MSIWNISEPVADFLFNLSNAVLILGAFLVFTGTIGSIWMQAAKSYFSDERIAANEAATARAKADAEIAREGAEAAHAKALEAELALEKYKAPRTLSPRIRQMDRGDTTQGLGKPSENVDSYFHPLPSSLSPVQTWQSIEIEGKFASSTRKRQSHLANPGSPSQVNDLISNMRKFQGQKFQITTFWEMKEPLDLSNNIYRSLVAAGWEYAKPETGHFLLGGMEGIQVWTHPSSGENVDKAAIALVDELNSFELGAVLKSQNEQNPKTDMINLNVGTKSQ